MRKLKTANIKERESFPGKGKGDVFFFCKKHLYRSVFLSASQQLVSREQWTAGTTQMGAVR